MSQSIQKKIGIATLIMMASIFLSRVIGLVREMTIAAVGGKSAAVDAYQISFILPEILNHAVAGGFLSITFIPIFSAYLAKDQIEKGYRVLSVIITVFGCALLAAVLVGLCLCRYLVMLLAPGLTDPATFNLAVKMTRIIIPAQLFFFAGGLFVAVQYAQEKFTIPALAPLIYNSGIILGGILLSPWLGMEGFSWGVLGGAFCGNFLLQFIGARKLGLRIFWCFEFKDPDLKRYVLLTLPLMVGFTMIFGVEVFLRYFGSYLPPGNLAGLNYGLRIMLMLAAFFGQAVGIASYPYMARMVTEKKSDQLNQLLNDTLRYLALVIPFAVLLFILRKEVVMILLQRGRFDLAATEFTSQVLAYLLIGAYGFAAQTVVVRVYYAMENTVLPAVLGTIAVAISIPLYWYGMQFLGAPGIALAISISALFQVWLLYIIWNFTRKNSGSRAVYGFIVKLLLICLILGGAVYRLKETFFVFDPKSIITNGFSVIIISGIFGTLFVTIGYLFKIKEIIDFTERYIWRRFKKGAG